MSGQVSCTLQSHFATSAPDNLPAEQVNLGPIICPGHSRPIPDVSYSTVLDHEFFLISGGLDKMPMIRRGDTGDWIGTFAGHKGAVWSARLNANARLAATASADFTVKLWDAVTGDELREFAHRHIAKTAVFSLDSNRLFTGGAEKKVRVFDLQKEDADPTIVLEGHTKSISNVVALPSDPNMVASSGDEKDIRVWDLRTGQLAKTLPTPGAVASVEVSACQNIMTATSGHEVQFWDTQKLELVKSFKLPHELKCASLHPECVAFVTGSMSELWVRVYDYKTGEEIGCQKGHHGPVRCIDFSPLGDAYASGSEDGTIRIWEFQKA